MENNYKIYMHKSPSGKVYIGQTKVTARKRWGHGNRYKSCILFQKAIDKYGWNNFEHKIIFKNLTQLDADMIETDLIYYYKKNNMSYNITDGGQGTHGYKMSEKRKEQLRINMTGKNNPFYGKTFDEDTKKHLSEVRKGRKPWNKGKKMTIEYCRKNSESHKGLQGGNKNGMFGKHRTNEEKQHLRELHNTKIYQFDLNGNYITEYESIKSAATAVGCKSPSKLSDCARGKSKSAYKFKWSFTKTLSNMDV